MADSGSISQAPHGGRHVAPDGRLRPWSTRLHQPCADPDSQHIDAVWEFEWEQNLLAAALDRVKCHVDPLKFQIFDLYVNQGWMPEKVARSCGISVDEVYLAKHRITQSIKSEVERLEREIG